MVLWKGDWVWERVCCYVPHPDVLPRVAKIFVSLWTSEGGSDWPAIV